MLELLGWLISGVITGILIGLLVLWVKVVRMDMKADEKSMDE